MAVGRINEVAAGNIGRNNEVAVRRGSTVIISTVISVTSILLLLLQHYIKISVVFYEDLIRVQRAVLLQPGKTRQKYKIYNYCISFRHIFALTWQIWYEWLNFKDDSIEFQK